MKKLIIPVLISIALAVFLCTTDIFDPAPTELTDYIGQPLSAFEKAFAVTFTDMNEYGKLQNTYRADNNSGRFDCVIDQNGNVIRIHLWESGSANYSICGITTHTDLDKAEKSWKMTVSR